MYLCKQNNSEGEREEEKNEALKTNCEKPQLIYSPALRNWFFDWHRERYQNRQFQMIIIHQYIGGYTRTLRTFIIIIFIIIIIIIIISFLIDNSVADWDECHRRNI